MSWPSSVAGHRGPCVPDRNVEQAPSSFDESYSICMRLGIFILASAKVHAFDQENAGTRQVVRPHGIHRMQDDAACVSKSGP